MSISTFVSITAGGVARAVRQNDDTWKTELIAMGEDVRCLATDPHHPGTIYAGTQGSGLYRSTDAGRTWQPAGLRGVAVKSIAVSPIEAGVIYAGAKPPMIFVSTDGGADWAELESFRQMRRWFWFTPAEPGAPYVQGIALSPADADVIVAGIEFGAVLRSADRGATWTGHLNGAIRDCHSLTFHATDGNWVYEAGGGGAAFSRDGGITWSQPKAGLDRRYGWACAADPARPEVWYAALSPSMAFPRFVPPAHIDGRAEAYIFRRVGDAPWEKLGGGLPQPLDYMPYALVTDPDMPGHLYAGLSNGDVWHSTNHGENWRQLPLNLSGIHRMMVALP